MAGASGKTGARELVGLVPAAGRARRLGPLPHSKELVPVRGPAGETRPVCEFLLARFRAAGIARALVVLRDEKRDIQAHLGAGAGVGLELDYLITAPTPDVPHTLDAAYPRLRDGIVALGFPDMIYPEADVFGPCLARLTAAGADVVLALFPGDRPEAMDMVATDDGGNITDIVIKQPDAGLSHCWAAALWTPAFTEFLHAHLAGQGAAAAQAELQTGPELQIGDVIRAAMAAGLRIEAVVAADEAVIDVGTPEELAKVRPGGG